MPRNRLDHDRQRHRQVVLDVRRDLGDPARASHSPIARTPPSPSAPPSRIRAAISRASSTVAGGASSTLNAMSGGRAATSTAPAVECSSARSEVGAQLARLDSCASTAGPPRRSCARVRPCASSPYRNTGSCSSCQADRRGQAPQRTRRRGPPRRDTRSAPRRPRRPGGECLRGGSTSILANRSRRRLREPCSPARRARQRA